MVVKHFEMYDSPQCTIKCSNTCIPHHKSRLANGDNYITFPFLVCELRLSTKTLYPEFQHSPSQEKIALVCLFFEMSNAPKHLKFGVCERCIKEARHAWGLNTTHMICHTVASAEPTFSHAQLWNNNTSAKSNCKFDLSWFSYSYGSA